MSHHLLLVLVMRTDDAKKDIQISAFWLTVLSRYLVSFIGKALLLFFFFSSTEILPGQSPVILDGLR